MIAVIVFAILGAVIYRARGMGLWPGRPWWQIAFAVPYGLAAFEGCDAVAAVLVMLLTVGAVLTGHASYIDLGSAGTKTGNAPADGGTDEWYGKWLPGSGYWHDFAGLVLSGMLITASAGAALALGAHFIEGLAVLLSGALKAPAYAIAKMAAPGSDVIAFGEALTGLFLWGCAAAVVIQIM